VLEVASASGDLMVVEVRLLLLLGAFDVELLEL